MDLYIDREELSRGLARVQGIIERRSTFPILSHVLLHAHADGLKMTATDTEVAYIGELAANIQKPGEIAVDAGNLFQVVRALPEATVRLTVTGNQRLEIQSGRSQFKLPGAAARDFPAIAAFDARGTARLPASALRQLVEQTSFSVATEEHRSGLNGAHMEERPGDVGKLLRWVSTDGHRLSASEVPFEGDVFIAPRTLIPRKALGILRKLLEGDDANIELSFGEGALRLVRPGQTFWFRLLDGEFPDYEAVVPKEGRHRVQIGRDELAAALKRVAIVVQDRARAVRFAFRESDLEIQVQNVDRGEVTEVVPIEIDGDPVTAGFNVRYLQDILSVIEGNVVHIEMAHALAPCLVRDRERTESFFVVMPMRLD
jgi:DNA polymerase-3 subunit beta